MRPRPDVVAHAEAIRAHLADGKWHPTAGLGGWGVSAPVRGAALNLLAAEEAIEHDTRRNVYRLAKRPAPRQTTIYEGGARGER